MEILTKHFGNHGNNPAKFIELSIYSGDTIIIEDVTDLNGKVDENLIASLRSLADELEEQNNLISQSQKNMIDQ